MKTGKLLCTCFLALAGMFVSYSNAQTVDVRQDTIPAPQNRSLNTVNAVISGATSNWSVMHCKNVTSTIIARSVGNLPDSSGIFLDTPVADNIVKTDSSSSINTMPSKTDESKLEIDTGSQSLQFSHAKLGEFVGEYTNGFAKLWWHTQAEYSTTHFEIERSRDGKDFVKVGNVEATGSMSSTAKYGFIDLKVQAGLNFYRLRIINADGSFSYSEVIVLKSEAEGINLLLVYPNPFGHKVQVKIESEKGTKVTIRVLDNAGNTVRIQQELIQKGTSVLLVHDVSKLPVGVYYLEVSTGEKTLTTKIMKQQ